MNARTSLTPTFALCTLALLFGGCTDDDGDGDSSNAGTTASDESGDGSDGADSSGDGAAFDEAEVIERAATYASTLEQVNVMPMSSAHGLADTVNVFVDSAAADLYRSIDTEAVADVGFPEGTLIVKEHLDGDGAADGFLLMYRGPEGYLPEAGGWFWARVDGAGATQETGAVGFCISCHEPVPGFVFGVPADNQM